MDMAQVKELSDRSHNLAKNLMSVIDFSSESHPGVILTALTEVAGIMLGASVKDGMLDDALNTLVKGVREVATLTRTKAEIERAEIPEGVMFQ